VHPVVVGAGTPYWPPAPLDLELAAARTLDGGVVHLRYHAR
jgi:hypothetical protein